MLVTKNVEILILPFTIHLPILTLNLCRTYKVMCVKVWYIVILC